MTGDEMGEQAYLKLEVKTCGEQRIREITAKAQHPGKGVAVQSQFQIRRFDDENGAKDLICLKGAYEELVSLRKKWDIPADQVVWANGDAGVFISQLEEDYPGIFGEIPSTPV